MTARAVLVCQPVCVSASDEWRIDAVRDGDKTEDVAHLEREGGRSKHNQRLCDPHCLPATSSAGKQAVMEAISEDRSLKRTKARGGGVGGGSCLAVIMEDGGKRQDGKRRGKQEREGRWTFYDGCVRHSAATFGDVVWVLRKVQVDEKCVRSLNNDYPSSFQ